MYTVFSLSLSSVGKGQFRTGIFENKLHSFSKPVKRLQAVRTVAKGGKFYRLPPDKENTVYITVIDKSMGHTCKQQFP